MDEGIRSEEAVNTGFGGVEPLYLHLSVTDPETVAVLSQATAGRDRQELALAALKVGILSLNIARGTVDGATIDTRATGSSARSRNGSPGIGNW
jgi:hypothetical protein